MRSLKSIRFGPASISPTQRSMNCADGISRVGVGLSPVTAMNYVAVPIGRDERPTRQWLSNFLSRFRTTHSRILSRSPSLLLSPEKIPASVRIFFRGFYSFCLTFLMKGNYPHRQSCEVSFQNQSRRPLEQETQETRQKTGKSHRPAPLKS